MKTAVGVRTTGHTQSSVSPSVKTAAAVVDTAEVTAAAVVNTAEASRTDVSVSLEDDGVRRHELIVHLRLCDDTPPHL